MWRALIVALALVTPCAARTAGLGIGFVITEDGDTFNITVSGETIVYHTPSSPWMYVAAGDLSFSTNNGDVTAKAVTDQRIPLRHFRIQHERDRDNNKFVLIELSSAEGLRIVVKLTSSEIHNFDVQFLTTPRHHSNLWLRLRAEPDERVYGGGQQWRHLNLRGQNYQMWARNRDTAADVTHDTTSYAQPTFVSTRRYLCHFHGYNYAELDFRPDRYHEVFLHGSPGGMSCDFRKTLKHAMQKVTFFTERPETMPDWIHEGAIVAIRGDTTRVLEVLSQARSAGVQVSAVYLESWRGHVHKDTGQRTPYDWRQVERDHPGLRETVQDLRRQGIRVLNHVTPHFQPGTQMYREAESGRYLVRNTSGPVHLQSIEGTEVATLDLTNPTAFEWFKGVLTRTVLDQGLSGWVAEGGSTAPVDGVYYGAQDTTLVHNHYPTLWARLNREVIGYIKYDCENLGEVIYITTTGAPFTSKYSLLVSLGEQSVDFSAADGLAAALTGALSLAITGATLTHYEIGGYRSLARGLQGGSPPLGRTEEMLLRSAETAVFSPVMRTSEGQLPDINKQFYSSDDILRAFARLTEIYKRLKPYRLQVERESRRMGILMMRPMFYHFGSDDVSYDVTDQYMFGEDLLVAPVLTPGAASREVYLPDDEWRHLFSDDVIRGPSRSTVPAGLGYPPVFFRTNSRFAHVFEYIRTSNAQMGQCDTNSDTCR